MHPTLHRDPKSPQIRISDGQTRGSQPLGFESQFGDMHGTQLLPIRCGTVIVDLRDAAMKLMMGFNTQTL